MKIHKIYYLSSLLIINCHEEKFIEFQNKKIAHVGNIFINLNKNNMENTLNILENKRCKLQKDLNNYNNEIVEILKIEVGKWENYLENIKIFYKQYENKEITEEIFLNKCFGILENSLYDLIEALEKNNINDNYKFLIKFGLFLCSSIKHQEDLSINMLINMVNNIGLLIEKLDNNYLDSPLFKKNIENINNKELNISILNNIFNISNP